MKWQWCSLLLLSNITIMFTRQLFVADVAVCRCDATDEEIDGGMASTHGDSVCCPPPRPRRLCWNRLAILFSAASLCRPFYLRLMFLEGGVRATIDGVNNVEQHQQNLCRRCLRWLASPGAHFVAASAIHYFLALDRLLCHWLPLSYCAVSFTFLLRSKVTAL